MMLSGNNPYDAKREVSTNWTYAQVKSGIVFKKHAVFKKNSQIYHLYHIYKKFMIFLQRSVTLVNFMSVLSNFETLNRTIFKQESWKFTYTIHM